MTATLWAVAADPTTASGISLESSAKSSSSRESSENEDSINIHNIVLCSPAFAASQGWRSNAYVRICPLSASSSPSFSVLRIVTTTSATLPNTEESVESSVSIQSSQLGLESCQDTSLEVSSIIIPRWIFNWWLNTDTLAWAATSPTATRIRVVCELLPQLTPPPYDQLDMTGASLVDSVTAKASEKERLTMIHLSRVSTFPWTPTSDGICSAEKTVKDGDASGKYLIDSAKDWMSNSSENLHGDLMVSGSIIMIPRNNRFGVFLVEKIVLNQDNVSIPRVVMDDSCRLFFAKSRALHPTYHHQSIANHKLAAFDQQSQLLHETLESSLFRRAQFEMLRIKPIQALYVCGVPGSGKEFFVTNTVCTRMQLPLVYFHMSDELQLLRRSDGTKVDLTPLKKACWKAILSAPCLLHIDGLSLLSNDSKFVDVNQHEAVEHILQILTETISMGVCIIATVVDPSKLPSRLQPSSSESRFFSKTIDLNIPTTVQREELAMACFTQLGMDSRLGLVTSDISVLSSRLSQYTAGFVSRDIFLLIIRATYSCLKHQIPSPDYKPHELNNGLYDVATAVDAFTEKLQKLTLDPLAIAKDQQPNLDIENIWKSLMDWLKVIPPSQSVNIGFDTTKRTVLWNQLGGYHSVKTKLSHLVIWPLQHPTAFSRLGVDPPSGILLYGPSGCGKTMFVHAIATESNMNFVMVKSHDLFSKYLGESEANIRSLFVSARKLSPCIIFFDEIDAIATRREWTEDGAGGVNERVLSTLLNEMDGVQERREIIVIACSNRPEKLDDALLRPGNGDWIDISMLDSDESDRYDIMRAYAASGSLLSLSEEEYRHLATITTNYTGADLESLIREAGICAMRESMDASCITMTHIQLALGYAYRGSIGQSLSFQNEESSHIGCWRPCTTTLEDLTRFETFGRRKK
ncbi:hypothetical protein BSLG_008141 [Batrachochytrium salamandrivorans]|nr:hypothetical protein BSLG_008141 [Batrachochytrium salamandrivorans]